MTSKRPPRNLFLHLSALSDSEYTTYVEALREIVDDGEVDGEMNTHARLSDDELEMRRVSLPVVRAWMKGRFRDLGPGEIDKVLQVFVAQVQQKEMSGGQLLAALRLLMHARHGGEILEGNVFVQANPSSPTTTRFPQSAPSEGLKAAFEVDRPIPDAPASPLRPESSTNPFFADPFLQNSSPVDLPRPPPVHPATGSPRRASLSSTPPVPPSTSKPRVEGMGIPPGSTNPFLQRAKTHSGSFQPTSSSGRTPPLPPRKPVHMSSSHSSHKPPVPAKPTWSISPRPSLQQSTSSNSASSSSTPPQSLPPPPPHRVTPLMQQSLLASRVGASQKRAQEEAERTRVLEVIRSSSAAQSRQSKDRDRTQSSSRSPEKSARRPVPRPPTSAYSDSGAPSEASLVEVASARLASRYHNRTRTISPDRMSQESFESSADGQDIEWKSPLSRPLPLSASEQFSPPPTHPARRPSVHSSGRGRHVRTPSYQSYHIQPNSAFTVASPFTKSISTSGISSQNTPSHSPSPSSSPSPSLSPVSPGMVRPMRSQSMHQPSSPIIMDPQNDSDPTGMDPNSNSPLPPPRRRRPESAQFASRPRMLDLDRNAAGDLDPSSPFSNTFGISQRSSGSSSAGVVSSIAARFENPSTRRRENSWDKDRERIKEPHAFATLQRTFSALQQRAQPTITRARYKAEAGILAPRRGFVPNGRDYHRAGEDGDRLVGDDDDDKGAGMDFSPVTEGDLEDEDESGGDTIRARGRGRAGRGKEHLTERDGLKFPEGEGWAQL